MSLMINELMLQTEARRVAENLYGKRNGDSAHFTERLIGMVEEAEDKDFLVIHNPGGWGCSPLEQCLDWERSIVEGVTNTIQGLGYSAAVTQHFRSGNGWWAHLRDLRDQERFFIRGRTGKARVLAAEVNFVTRCTDKLQVIMVGVSQGAAFNNAVMRQLGEAKRVYSIELGIIFAHIPRRVVTARTLAIDNNGICPDPLVNPNVWEGIKSYGAAPLIWLKYQLQRRPQRFTRCIHMPGHDYNWKYPAVRQRIEDFLSTAFGGGLEGGNHEARAIH